MSEHGMVLVAQNIRIVPSCLCGWVGPGERNATAFSRAAESWTLHVMAVNDYEEDEGEQAVDTATRIRLLDTIQLIVDRHIGYSWMDDIKADRIMENIEVLLREDNTRALSEKELESPTYRAARVGQ